MKAKVYLTFGALVLVILFVLAGQYLLYFSRRDSGGSVWRTALLKVPMSAKDVDKATRATSSCFRTYFDFYRKRDIEIRVVFGYKDARPARFVGDRYEKIALVQALLKKCPENYFACGFRRDPDDADLFFREIKGLDNSVKKVRLRIAHSSVGPDDNRNRGDSFQKWQSQYARSVFLNGLKKADAVFYNGHSRDGGGPDFGPPRLRADGSPHYYWYAATKPGFKVMINVLESSLKHPKLVGLFSCASTKLFMHQMLEIDETLGLITSPKLLYYADAMKNLLGSLSALLGMWCEEDFRQSIQEDKSGRNSVLTNFFSQGRR